MPRSLRKSAKRVRPLQERLTQDQKRPSVTHDLKSAFDRAQRLLFVKTARRYRTIEIQASDHVITAADPLPHDLQEALDRIQRETTTH